MTRAVSAKRGHGRHQRRSLPHRIWLIASRLFMVAMLGVTALVIGGRAAGYQSLIVLSGSMGRTAPVGSLVAARPIPAEKVDVGTVVLLSKPGQTPVLHRVIERTERDGDVVVRTKGDANPSPDPLPTILRGEVITPVLVFPRLGYALSFLQSPVGWATLILIPLVFAALSALRRRRPARHAVGSTESADDLVESPAEATRTN